VEDIIMEGRRDVIGWGEGQQSYDANRRPSSITEEEEDKGQRQRIEEKMRGDGRGEEKRKEKRREK
jgi:hypothetical protein